MSSKNPLLNFDGLKAAKLYPLLFALGAIVFSLYWASGSVPAMGVGDLIVRVIAAIGISINFGMSIWELYVDAKKTLAKKAKEERIDQDLSDLLEHKEAVMALLNQANVKLDNLEAGLKSTNGEVTEIKRWADSQQEIAPTRSKIV